MEILTATKRFTKNDEILLMPVGDIQWAGSEDDVSLERLRKHIRWGVENGAYFIGMGDYVDLFSPSNRSRLQGADLYETATSAIDIAARSFVDELFKKALKPSRGRWLGLLEGHHFHQFKDGTTTDQYLCSMLDAPFLGSCAYIRLLFSKGKDKQNHAGRVLIWAHHGSGSGRIAAPLNKLELLPTYWDGDIFLMGHQTKKVSAPLDRCEPVFHGVGSRLSHRTIIIACTGGFSRGYVPHRREGKIPRGNYVEKGMMTPVSLGGVLVKIRPRWVRGPDGNYEWRPDLNVEL